MKKILKYGLLGLFILIILGVILSPSDSVNTNNNSTITNNSKTNSNTDSNTNNESNNKQVA